MPKDGSANPCECLLPRCRKCHTKLHLLGMPSFPMKKGTYNFPYYVVCPQQIDHEHNICILDPRVDENNVCIDCHNTCNHTPECDYLWSIAFDQILVHAKKGFVHNSVKLCLHSITNLNLHNTNKL